MHRSVRTQNLAIMNTSNKALVQTNGEGRGFLNGNINRLANYTNEITFNVDLGYDRLLHYYWIGWLKFASLEDAMEYVQDQGATEGTVSGKEYYSVTKQEGCCFQSIGFYSVKDKS